MLAVFWNFVEFAFELSRNYCVYSKINLLGKLSFYYKTWNNFFGGGGVTLQTVGKFSVYKSRSSELGLLQNTDTHVEVCLNN